MKKANACVKFLVTKKQLQKTFFQTPRKMVVDKPLVSYDASEAGTKGVIVTLDLLKIIPAGQPQNFIYIVDKSASMWEDIGYVRDILGVWLQTAPSGSGVLIVTFSDTANVLFHTHYLLSLSSHKAILRGRLLHQRTNDSTIASLSSLLTSLPPLPFLRR